MSYCDAQPGRCKRKRGNRKLQIRGEKDRKEGELNENNITVIS